MFDSFEIHAANIIRNLSRKRTNCEMTKIVHVSQSVKKNETRETFETKSKSCRVVIINHSSRKILSSQFILINPDKSLPFSPFLSLALDLSFYLRSFINAEPSNTRLAAN